MKELSKIELKEINGGSRGSGIGYAVGYAVGYFTNSVYEAARNVFKAFAEL